MLDLQDFLNARNIETAASRSINNSGSILWKFGLGLLGDDGRLFGVEEILRRQECMEGTACAL